MALSEKAEFTGTISSLAPLMGNGNAISNLGIQSNAPSSMEQSTQIAASPTKGLGL